MYKVIVTIDQIHHIVLALVNITTGETRYWRLSSHHAELLCKQYHVKHLQGVLLDDLPQNGGWLDVNDFNRI